MVPQAIGYVPLDNIGKDDPAATNLDRDLPDRCDRKGNIGSAVTQQVTSAI